MDYKNAKALFEQYLDGYDRNDDKVRLKIVHTYGVVKQSEEIAKRMGLSEEDTELARMIALLQEIGRFEQLKRFDSFLPETMDHAAYGVKVLFGDGKGGEEGAENSGMIPFIASSSQATPITAYNPPFRRRPARISISPQPAQKTPTVSLIVNVNRNKTNAQRSCPSSFSIRNSRKQGIKR